MAQRYSLFILLPNILKNNIESHHHAIFLTFKLMIAGDFIGKIEQEKHAEKPVF